MTYEYYCSENKEHTYSEIRSITENQTKFTCAEEGCDGKLLRKFTAPPITFKGTGFQGVNR